MLASAAVPRAARALELWTQHATGRVHCERLSLAAPAGAGGADDCEDARGRARGSAKDQTGGGCSGPGVLERKLDVVFWLVINKKMGKWNIDNLHACEGVDTCGCMCAERESGGCLQGMFMRARMYESCSSV